MSLHPRDKRHGTRAGYLAGCTCEPCVKAHSRYCKEYHWRRMNGATLTVDFDTEVRPHVERLLTMVSKSGVAFAAGTTSGHLCRLLTGQNTRLHKNTADRLLAVTLDSIPDRQFVNARGARRRVQALMRLGYPMRHVAVRVGYEKTNMRNLVRGDSTTITAATHRKIAAAFDAMCMRVPTGVEPKDRAQITRARRRGEAEGWAYPLDWDDIDFDDHPVTLRVKGRSHRDVDFAVVEALLAGRHVDSTRAEKDEAMRRWLAMGRSERSLCAIHGWHDDRYGKSDDGRAA